MNTDFLNDIGTELLDGKRTDIALELTNYCIAESAVIQVKNVLHHLLRA
jgi:hypothetical protein